MNLEYRVEEKRGIKGSTNEERRYADLLLVLADSLLSSY